MDGDVLQNIDLFPAANSKVIDSIIDNSSNCIRQLSSISFWDNFDNPIDSSAIGAPTATVTLQNKARTPSFGSTIGTTSEKSPQPSRVGCKRPRTPERKRTRIGHEPTALDCSDYWLRFDSDDDSLEREYDYQYPSTTRRQQGSIQPAARIRRVEPPANYKLAFPSPPLDDFIDDSALDHALSDGDDSFTMALDNDFMKGDTTPPQDIAPERLYSTPLSWEAPQPGLQVESYFNVNPAFNDPERQRLLAIAMGTGMAPTTTSSTASRPSTSTDFNFDFDVHHSPTMSESTTPEPARRKASMSRSARPSPPSTADPPAKPKEKPKNNERAAHNDIERKYRTNLKDRIAELREAVPSLRSIPEDEHDDEDSPIMASRAPKASKGTVLTKATEYIRQLERRNRNMAQKNDELTRRLQAFEQLLGASPGPNWQPRGYGASVFNPRGYPS